MRPASSERSIDALLEFGVINLDKPAGPTSHQVSAWVRDLLGIDRAGHVGTLDPKVTGCLPILLGDATRVAEALLGRKAYVAVLEFHDAVPESFESILAEFEGEIYQKPPRKSAVSRRLRTREIFELTALEVADRRALLRIECEPGTYVRKLCHDIGLVAGTGAHMGDLRRVGTAPFDDTDLVTLHDLVDALADYEERSNEGPLREIVAPGERALAPLRAVTIAPSAAREVANGAPVYAPGVIEAEGDPAERPSVACYTPDGAAVCLGTLVGDPSAERGVVVDLDRVLV